MNKIVLGDFNAPTENHLIHPNRYMTRRSESVTIKKKLKNDAATKMG
jgi:hypothetical protein